MDGFVAERKEQVFVSRFQGRQAMNRQRVIGIVLWNGLLANERHSHNERT
jgi:hypothetical protein